MSIYQFAFHDGVPNKEEFLKLVENIELYKLYEKGVVNKQKLSRSEKDLLYQRLNKYGVLKLYGWAISFKSILKCYWIKYNYDYIYEVYAPDKTSIRNSPYETGILKIVEVK